MSAPARWVTPCTAGAASGPMRFCTHRNLLRRARDSRSMLFSPHARLARGLISLNRTRRTLIVLRVARAMLTKASDCTNRRGTRRRRFGVPNSRANARPGGCANHYRPRLCRIRYETRIAFWTVMRRLSHPYMSGIRLTFKECLAIRRVRCFRPIGNQTFQGRTRCGSLC